MRTHRFSFVATAVAATFMLVPTASMASEVEAEGAYLVDIWDAIMAVNDDEDGVWNQYIGERGQRVAEVITPDCAEDGALCVEVVHTYPTEDKPAEFKSFELVESGAPEGAYLVDIWDAIMAVNDDEDGVWNQYIGERGQRVAEVITPDCAEGAVSCKTVTRTYPTEGNAEFIMHVPL